MKRQCWFCRQKVELTKNGMFFKHVSPISKLTCHGTGQKPDAVDRFYRDRPQVERAGMR